MKHPSSKRIKITFFVIVLLTLSIYLLFTFNQKQSLYKNYKISNAYITELSHGSTKSGSTVIKYQFSYLNKNYNGGIDSDISYSIHDSLLKRFFPVVFDSTNPSNNVLLIDIHKWEKLKVKFPDSLLWVKKYYPDNYF